ncbi:MAG: 4'-phosphopantetheinyl transferase superfamily protein [Acidimicrobiia bacterium]|nr:4'-phosphopantetheinyl transferase superfamily protein [Acidimicrobiia bacterium]
MTPEETDGGPARVDVWFRPTLDISAARLDAARSLLSAEEQTRARRFRFAEDARDYVLAHALVRESLSASPAGRSVEPPAWAFGVAPGGKPFAEPGGTPSFNLSHTRGLVACAVSEGAPVGVDVERADRLVDARAVAARYFSRAERAWLDRLDASAFATGFLTLWTLKEAFVKAVGAGLSFPLPEAAFALDGPSTIVFHGPPAASGPSWHFALFQPTSDTRLAVAVQAGEPPRITVRSWVDREEGPASLAPLRTSAGVRVGLSEASGA